MKLGPGPAVTEQAIVLMKDSDVRAVNMNWREGLIRWPITGLVKVIVTFVNVEDAVAVRLLHAAP